MTEALQTAYVRSLRMETPEVLVIELEPQQVSSAWTEAGAGAHIDIQVPGAGVRQYSLMPSPTAGTWRIGVARDAKSRGGSQWVHTVLRPGQTLQVSAPRNHFALDESAAPACLIGGGIGITPILAMAYALEHSGREWQLHYCVRSRDVLGFTAELARWGDRVQLHVRDEQPANLDMAQLVATAQPGTHFYCCGPQSMIESFMQATASVDPACVHREYFAAPAATGSGVAAGSFVVELVRSCQNLTVGPDDNLLDVLLAHGVDVPYSCQNGVCGSCETRVVSGEVDHRDVVLSDAERASHQTIIVCCSRAKSERLVLDL